jgi:hypothetical protein
VAAAAILDADGDGQNDVWLATEYSGQSDRSVQRHRLFINSGGGSFRTPLQVLEVEGGGSTTLATGDFDMDGQVDVFVGHRTVPGKGPAPGSRLLKGEGGSFRDVTAQVAPALLQLRTVTDALWADLEGDGFPDLLVAGEWMPLTLLSNEGSELRETTADAGLDSLVGWWQSLAAADFDRDGDLDVVAGNLGLSHPYHPNQTQPFRLYVADFDGDGEDDAVPAYFEGGELYPWFGRSRLSEILPWVQELYPTLDAYGRAPLQEIVGAEALAGAERFEVGNLATMYLENLGDGTLRPIPLPRAAQLSPVFGMAPADFDGDGHLDLALAGNLYALDPNIPRLDGGVGLFLRGNGNGAFEPTFPSESGLWLHGPARGLSLLRIGPSRAPAILAGFVGDQARLFETRNR